MKLAIMQPYLFPYIGYFQLIEAVDVFVIYDNIEYTKKGWINRNRILRNGQETTFSIPLERDSDFLHIRDRAIAADFKPNKVLALCAATRSKTYINPIGGVNLYSKEEFATNDVELQFLNSGPIEYSQFDNAFVPWLSIIDVMMFNSTDQIATMLNSCEHH
jgi:hypothetical protein